jgi:hypothetical protein
MLWMTLDGKGPLYAPAKPTGDRTRNQRGLTSATRFATLGLSWLYGAPPTGRSTGPLTEPMRSTRQGGSQWRRQAQNPPEIVAPEIPACNRWREQRSPL